MTEQLQCWSCHKLPSGAKCICSENRLLQKIRLKTGETVLLNCTSCWQGHLKFTWRLSFDDTAHPNMKDEWITFVCGFMSHVHNSLASCVPQHTRVTPVSVAVFHKGLCGCIIFFLLSSQKPLALSPCRITMGRNLLAGSNS